MLPNRAKHTHKQQQMGKPANIKKETSHSVTGTESMNAKNKPFLSTGEWQKTESCQVKRKEMLQTKGNTNKTKYQGSFQ